MRWHFNAEVRVFPATIDSATGDSPLPRTHPQTSGIRPWTKVQDEEVLRGQRRKDPPRPLLHQQRRQPAYSSIGTTGPIQRWFYNFYPFLQSHHCNSWRNVSYAISRLGIMESVNLWPRMMSQPSDVIAAASRRPHCSWPLLSCIG